MKLGFRIETYRDRGRPRFELAEVEIGRKSSERLVWDWGIRVSVAVCKLGIEDDGAEFRRLEGR